jgi:hypothetical protein
LIKSRLKSLIFATFSFLVLLLVLFPAGSVFAVGMGHGFYGTVTVGGVLANTGTVSAQVGGGGSASSSIASDGSYGLIVQGTIDDGATIHFYVNGQEAGQTDTFHDGRTTQLNLTVAAPVPVQYTLTYTTGANGSITGTSPQ